jgi:predicted dienelactone hydrolase
MTMRRSMCIAMAAAALLMLSMATTVAGTVGFHRVSVPDPAGTPRDVGIWYPSETAASTQALGPYRQSVAIDGAVAGRSLPLVLILHGVQGSFENHYDLALALAEAGFVVAGIQQSQDIALLARPQHVSKVLDYMLGEWPDRDRLDPRRIGLYGFSVGGFTALVVIGGEPDLGRVGPYCAEHPDRVCAMLKERGTDLTIPPAAWSHDRRIAAAVIAAPTLGFTFGGNALASVGIPLQLWRAADDAITPHPWHAEAIHGALPGSPEYIVVPNAGHFAFVARSTDLASRAPDICQDSPTFDRPAFHLEFNAAVVAFFAAHLAAR